MGYAHIANLYQRPQFLSMFPSVVAMEKIHGTSAHVQYTKGKELEFYSGGAKMLTFRALFNEKSLLQKFEELGRDNLTVYGEAYGGSMHKMSKTYGPSLKFVVFDVFDGTELPDGTFAPGSSWLPTAKAEELAKHLGLEFVPYKIIPCTLEALNAERDADSVQAVRNGMGPGHLREGIVAKPEVDVFINNMHRVIVKHKRQEFAETRTEKVIDPALVAERQAAGVVANEWVTEMRLTHVLDKLQVEGKPLELPDTPKVMRAMVEDVQRESTGVVVWSEAITVAVGAAARTLFVQRCRTIKQG